MGDYAAVISTRFPGCRLERSWPLAGGVSATTVGLEVAHKDGRVERLVLRQLSTADFKGEAPLASIAEHALVCRLHALDLPVPRPRLADVSRTLLAQPYVVYDFVEGCTAGPAPAPMAEAMADLLRRVHRVNHEGLPDTLPRRDSPLPDLDQFVEVAVFDRVTQRWSGGRPGVLLHGDYWPGNLLWRGEQIVALVDWEDAAIGDPFSDLACARVELLCTVGEEVMERFTEQYLRLAGPFAERDTADLVAWDV